MDNGFWIHRTNPLNILNLRPMATMTNNMLNHLFVPCRAVQRRLDRGHHWLMTILDGVTGI